MTAEPDCVVVGIEANCLVFGIEADDSDTLDRIKGVLASHLDRFALREAPLPCEWSPAAG